MINNPCPILETLKINNLEECQKFLNGLIKEVLLFMQKIKILKK